MGWNDFGESLTRTESELAVLRYQGAFSAPMSHGPFYDLFPWYRPPPDTIRISHIDLLLSERALAPPHGIAVLDAPVRTETVYPPQRPKGYISAENATRHESLLARLESFKKSAQNLAKDDLVRAAAVRTAFNAGEVDAVREVVLASLSRHPLPHPLSYTCDLVLDLDSAAALCTVRAPDFSRLSIVREKRPPSVYSPDDRLVPKSEHKRSLDRLLYSLCIRAAYLTAMAVPRESINIVVINVFQEWADPATGRPASGVVASMQGTVSDLCALRPGHLDAKACFRHFAGVATPNILNSTPVRPIFSLDTADSRIVPARDVAATLDEAVNLAAMDWEDFEHLVRQVLEWSFAGNGIEIRVTRASRDRGVDAIMFDPDPIRGGKYVVQAKRYTRTVDVAAVRELYGTVVNEGANRGILVTTATFGPDAYEFAKDKPISLVDGPNLLALLQKNGRHYRIDLAEARQEEAARQAD